MRNRRRRFHGLTGFLRFLAFLIPAGVLIGMMCQMAFATTYVITDGDRVITYTTFATDPEAVLDQAGLNLGRSDTYTTAADDGDASITIRRAQAVTVDYRGEELHISSTGETVGALLSRLSLDITDSDSVSHSLEEMTYDGMKISVDQVILREESYTVVIPREVIRCDCGSLPEGAERIEAEGADGELLRTAEVMYVNGREVGRTVLREEVTIPAVRQIVSVGTGEASDEEQTLTIADGVITLPTGEKLTYSHTTQVEATAYTHTDAGCNMITYTGSTVHIGTVAVDPRYIPYGTRMFIVSNDGSYVYGISEAEDCGGDIKGSRVDLYFPTFSECMQFGRRNCTIYFLT